MSAAAQGPASAARYDPVARATHWLVAALAIAAVALGWAFEGAPRGAPARDVLLVLHRSIGLTILVAMVFRAWWRWRHPPPPLRGLVPQLIAAAAGANHFLLYAAFIAMPVAGYVNAAAAGHWVSYFGLFDIPPLIPKDDRLSQFAVAIHLAGQYVVYLAVALHTAGALYHWAVRRDGVFERMLPEPRTR